MVGGTNTHGGRARRPDATQPGTSESHHNHEILIPRFTAAPRGRGPARYLITASRGERLGLDSTLPAIFSAAFDARSMNRCALSESGLAITIGTPASPPNRIRVSIGISPKKSVPTSWASRLPPPWLKISSEWPHAGHL